MTRWFVYAGLWMWLGAPLSAGEQVVLQVRGALYCLDEKGAPSYAGGEACSSQGHRYALINSAGKVCELARGEISEGLYVDRRLHERILFLTLVNREQDGKFDVVKVQTVVDGLVYDAFYFCDVCNIKSFAPGPCDCCREPYKFVEEPAGYQEPRITGHGPRTTDHRPRATDHGPRP